MGKDKFVPYNKIFKSQIVEEGVWKNPQKSDPNVRKDLAILLQMNQLEDKMNSFIKIQKEKIARFREKLRYSYDEYNRRDDIEYRRKNSKKILQNAEWKKEISLMNDKDKVDILNYIMDRDLTLDQLKFINDDDKSITCYSVFISALYDPQDCEGNEGDDRDDDISDDSGLCVAVCPEFLLNAAWSLEKEIKNPMLQVDIEQIKEIIVNKVKYKFLF